MKETEINEFIQYKSGFQSGKDEIIELTRLGKILNFDNVKEELPTFFEYGYKDAIEYFSKQVSNGIDIATIRTKDVVKEMFIERVIKHNRENGESISMSSFKIR